jgi:hypothetical protein
MDGRSSGSSSKGEIAMVEVDPGRFDYGSFIVKKVRAAPGG